MAAGGGRGVAGPIDILGAEHGLEFGGDGTQANISSSSRALRINTQVGSFGTGMRRNIGEPASASGDEDDPGSAVSSVASSATGDSASSRGGTGNGTGRDVWDGDISCVIGLQKRGLRGLMEGRRLRERGASVGNQGTQRTGLGIA